MKPFDEQIERRATLCEDDLWTTHGPTIWSASEFVGTPRFYPVYKHGDYYSYSLLSLIRLKGTLRLNKRVASKRLRRRMPYISGANTIDRDIVRIGGTAVPTFAIRDTDTFLVRLAAAMKADAATIEAKHAGYTNVIMCGGKDSLNLALLPWKNPVVLASAPPNHELVRQFVSHNDLQWQVVRIEDGDRSLLEEEVLINACRNNLAHFRWGPDLRRLARTYEHSMVFWKGQLGSFMKPRWNQYRHPPKTGRVRFLEAVSRWFGGHIQREIDIVMKWSGLAQRRYFTALWKRGAMWQGSHVGFIRELTGSLVVSGYHGPSVANVVREADLGSVVRRDVRPALGALLLGRPVWYPPTNPGPEISAFRASVSNTETFLHALSKTNVRIVEDSWPF